MAYMIKENVWAQDVMDSLAEWSKALAQGASPQGRGFEPHSCHLPCALAQSAIAKLLFNDAWAEYTNRAHGVVVSHPLSMREALGSIPSVSILHLIALHAHPRCDA